MAKARRRNGDGDGEAALARRGAPTVAPFDKGGRRPAQARGSGEPQRGGFAFRLFRKAQEQIPPTPFFKGGNGNLEGGTAMAKARRRNGDGEAALGHWGAPIVAPFDKGGRRPA